MVFGEVSRDNGTEAVGGSREHWYPRYELLKKVIFERMAMVMTQGAEKYGEGNWEKFTPEQMEDIPRHILVHIMDYMNGDRSEDHMANIACNVMMYMFLIDHFEDPAQSTVTDYWRERFEKRKRV